MADIPFLGGITITPTTFNDTSAITKSYADNHYLSSTPGSHFHIGGVTCAVENGAIVLNRNCDLYLSYVDGSQTYTLDSSAVGIYNLDYLRFELIITTGVTVGTLTFPAFVTWVSDEPELTTQHVYRITFESQDRGTTWIASLTTHYAKSAAREVEEELWMGYEGNYKMKEVSNLIVLEEGYYVYLLDLTDTDAATVGITINPGMFGFTETVTGGAIRLVIKTPSTDIPTITFGSNIVWADFEEVDRWEADMTYCFNLITNDGGVNWVIAETEVY